jgi:hypothetical protein
MEILVVQPNGSSDLNQVKYVSFYSIPRVGLANTNKHNVKNRQGDLEISLVGGKDKYQEVAYD